MDKKLLLITLALTTIIPLALFGCKGRVERLPEAPITEAPGIAPIEEALTTSITEPAQTVATETIPPTAAPEIATKPIAMPSGIDRNKDIQRALKAAGFYAGAIDGKIGAKTKQAIMDFQKAKGLKVDGKVGPKTWAELEKYLT